MQLLDMHPLYLPLNQELEAVIIYNNCSKGCIVNSSNANRSNASNRSNYAVSAAVIIAQITVANEEGEGVSISNSYKP